MDYAKGLPSHQNWVACKNSCERKKDKKKKTNTNLLIKEENKLLTLKYSKSLWMEAKAEFVTIYGSGCPLFY